MTSAMAALRYQGWEGVEAAHWRAPDGTEIERLKPTDMEWALAQPVHHFQYLLTFKTHKLVPTLAAPHSQPPGRGVGKSLR